MDSHDLYLAARELLEAAETAVATTEAGAIERAYVSPGLPAFDCCPQLTVHAGGTGEGDTLPLNAPLQPGHRTSQTARVNLVQFTITTTRCAPVGTDSALPSPAGLEAAAVACLDDLWAIWNGLAAAHRAGTLFTADAGPGSREMFFDAAIPLDPQGGCAGWLIPVRVSLGGYTP